MRVAYVNVFVRDLAHATEFYRDKLGLQLQFSSAEHGYASLSVGGIRLGIAVPGPDQAELVGRHTGVGLEVADLQAEHLPDEATEAEATIEADPADSAATVAEAKNKWM